MKPDKYCIIGYGCILSEEKILNLFSKYLPHWKINDGFNMDGLRKKIKDIVNTKLKIDFFHDCNSYNNVFLTIYIAEDTSKYRDHSFKNFDYKYYETLEPFLKIEMKKLIEILNLNEIEFGWKIFNYRM